MLVITQLAQVRFFPFYWRFYSFTELPETSFTRSISNPEAVMRRRRQQKLERKLQQFRSKDGGPDTGGTLKIYGEALCKDVPYKTLLLSVRDSAAQVVREMLSKYGLEKVDPQLYCLVQVSIRVDRLSANSTHRYLRLVKHYKSDETGVYFSLTKFNEIWLWK